MDQKDEKILDLLVIHGDYTTSQISKKTNIPITTVHNRIKKMKREGVIKNFSVNIDFVKIGKKLKGYILLTVNQVSQQEVARRVRMIDGIYGVDIVTGTTDMVIVVRAADMDELSSIITKRLRKINGVDKTQTLMVLEEF